MSSFDAIVLASDLAGELSRDPQLTHSALVPLFGKPMLDWVVDALRQSRQIESITVVGPEFLDELLSKRHIHKRISPAAATLSDFRSSPNRVDGYIIVPCEAVYLTSETIDKATEAFVNTGADMGIPYVLPEKFPSGMPLPLSTEVHSQRVIPGVVSFVKNPKLIPAAINKLVQFNREKKILSDAGVILPAIAAIEDSILERTDFRFELFRSDNPEVALLVRSNEELRHAARILPNPYTPKFKKVKLIANPKSGQGIKLPNFLQKAFGVRKRALDNISDPHLFLQRISQYLHEYGLTPEIEIGKSSEDASRIARDCARKKYDLVIAAGGDGTINAVINGLASSETAFGAIPLGTVNLFALQFNIPMEVRASCQVIAEGNIRTVDLGKADEHFFICLSGIGFDAFVIRNADTKLKKFLGVAAYILTGITKLPRYSFNPVKLYVETEDGIFQSKGYSVIIGNGKYYSANMLIAPQGKIDDGFFDVIIFKRKSIFSFFHYIREFRKGNLTEAANVEYYRCKKVWVLKHGRHYFHIDGEPLGRTPVNYTINPAALKVVC
ncbi:Transcription regulator [contains diacylglycerol kinase catalytic domain] [Chitinispirillum alkaliphilum]|nr:Transcription regulator [contains diacylglycerol kinase catalytic domain] [Chitinispirillum alkaliphilum]